MGLLSFEEYGAGIGDAWTVLREHANRIGPEAGVPPCPGWTVRDLVAHQGMVHRWVTAVLRGERVDVAAVEAEGRAVADQLAWLDEGVTALLQAFVDTPEDAERWFLWPDPGPARLAWARRQCHETTVHALDAMAASLGRPPTACEAWFGAPLAADGVDELLTGFLSWPKAPLRTPEPTSVLVEASDTGGAWTLVLGPDDPPESRRGTTTHPDVTVRGPARDLLLTLWNRATPESVTVSDPALLTTWRALARI
ncbi:MAG: maleylpyruvate isomerase family mycothiol-dependent enzyme [Marmoricola sp.]